MNTIVGALQEQAGMVGQIAIVKDFC